jgi:hypothetical protein
VFSIKALALATAVSAGVVFAMPATSQATSATVKVHTSVGVNHKSGNWWTRHCMISNDVKCGHHYSRFDRHHRYYGHYRPYYRHHHKSGVNIQVN